jgi:hypothetical protein
MDYGLLQWMEFLSYTATVVGIPLAIITFIYQERKERQSEQEEIYDKLMQHYSSIQAMLFEHPELDQHDVMAEDPETRRRQRILYEMLASLFERAFILLYGETDPAYLRMWNSWNDYIEFWAEKPNFRESLPKLMIGEDPDFVAYLGRVTGLQLEHLKPTATFNDRVQV